MSQSLGSDAHYNVIDARRVIMWGTLKGRGRERRSSVRHEAARIRNKVLLIGRKYRRELSCIVVTRKVQQEVGKKAVQPPQPSGPPRVGCRATIRQVASDKSETFEKHHDLIAALNTEGGGAIRMELFMSRLCGTRCRPRAAASEKTAGLLFRSRTEGRPPRPSH